MYPFRVFLCYAHEDKPIVERLDSILRQVGLLPVWDRHIQPGTPFTDTIKKQIATSHLFMPLITQHSQHRPWVHQETGFAMGIDIPVLPIVLESLGGAMKDALQAMIETLQALEVKDDLSNLAALLQQTLIEDLVLPSETEPELERLMISNQVADYSQDRTRLLVRYARSVREAGRVRQRALFSSFSLPAKPPRDAAWDLIDSPRSRSDHYRDWLRREREILEKHARGSGCSLIISPFVNLSSEWATAHCAQLRELHTFLRSMPADKLRVVILEGELVEGNLTLVGDWVGAKATSPPPGTGYRQTLFSRHAPTVLRWLQEFEQAFESRLRFRGMRGDQSKEHAIKRIEELLEACRSVGK